MSAPKPSFAEWVAKANVDLQVIEITTSVPDPPWDAVCFHAQQATEKLLKARICDAIRERFQAGQQ